MGDPAPDPPPPPPPSYFKKRNTATEPVAVYNDRLLTAFFAAGQLPRGAEETAPVFNQRKKAWAAAEDKRHNDEERRLIEVHVSISRTSYVSRLTGTSRILQLTSHVLRLTSC